LGRFISRDPIDVNDSVNLYSYVYNSPVNYVDPYGEFWLDTIWNFFSDAWMLFLWIETVNAPDPDMVLKESYEQSQNYWAVWNTALVVTWFVWVWKSGIARWTKKVFSKSKKVISNSIIKIKKKINKILWKQNHHFLTNKHKTFSKDFIRLIKPYNLSLNWNWNKQLMRHSWRHAEKYHKFMLTQIENIHKIAKWNKNIFLKEFNKLKQYIIKNPDILQKKWWK